jgi:hypothetical protein
VDRDGIACSYCTTVAAAAEAKKNIRGSGNDASSLFGLCVTQDQADLASEYGLACSVDTTTNVATTKATTSTTSTTITTNHQDFPDDLIDCLEHYQESDCRQSACIWCNTQVGMGFCVTEAVADLTKSFPFFDCEFGTTTRLVMMMETTTKEHI